MEQSLSSLAFKGSIAEAVSEAKRQKKLFVVYTAGDNPESKQLETSTWIEPNVCGTLSKCCILLHILEGSSEASKFSAIYPQHSAPCITAVGYNGVQLWQSKGFVSADVLASSLEKAWLSLHVQETTAAFLTAALASGKQLRSETSWTTSSEQVIPGTYVSSPATDDRIPSLDTGESSHCERIEDRNSYEDASKGLETYSKQGGVDFPEPSFPNVLDNGELESASKNESGNTSRDPVHIDQNNPKVQSPVPENSSDFCDNLLGSSSEFSQEIISGASEAVEHVNTEDIKEVEKDDASDSSTIKSNDVFLSIRVPDGSSLQVKYSVMDTLRMVKDYIDENKTSSFGSYSIAIPYPRKVFDDQDLDSTLSELGLLNRQALVVVPQDQNNLYHGGGSSQNQTYSSNDASSLNASEGYWASVKRMLSYVNPFAYLSRGASSPSAAEESQSGMWQYTPNPSLQNTLRGGGRPSTFASSDQSTPGRNSNSKSRQQTSRFGGNIHTLKHDDDDDSRFNDRNAFWNGNSTEYGGNNDDRK